MRRRLCAILTILTVGTATLFGKDLTMNKNPLRYWMRHQIGPLDTLKSDRADLMPVAKNIYATLVSVFMDGEPQPMVADSWAVDSSGKTWKFHIRKGLVFDDNTPITTEVVLENLRRVLWVTRNDGLALNALLPELKRWKRKDDPLQSLYADGDFIVFQFSRRPVSLFEEISMPIYGIANPKCFESSGEWISGGCPSSSGQYRIIDKTSTKLVLESRHIYPESHNAPDMVEIHSPSASERNIAQVLLEGKGDLASQSNLDLGTETIAILQKKGFSVLNEPALRMHFVQLNHKKGVFSDKTLRQSVRNIFLQILGRSETFNAQADLNPSFVPKGGMGYLDFDIPTIPAVKKMSGQEVEILVTPLPADVTSKGYAIRSEVEKALQATLKSLGLTAKITRCGGGDLIERRQRGEFDAVLLSSGLSIYDPYCALRMMFTSDIGAQIPDPSGEIPRLIEAAEASDSPEIRKKYAEQINASIFEEGAVITYTTSGYVYLHSNRVDLSRINLFSDPVEFRAIGWNTETSR